MKIAIIGPGAIGTLFSALLARLKSSRNSAFDDIWVLDHNKSRVAEISRQGMSVEGGGVDFKIPVKITLQPSDIGEVDLAVICVKSYDTKTALADAKPIFGGNTMVLTLQNGIGNIDVISEAVGAEKVIGGITNFGSTLIGNGRVRLAGRGETVIGRIDGKIPVEMRYIREIFNKAGIPARISRDIKGVLWSKLVINAGINALSAVSGLENGRLTQIESARRILRDCVTESVKVAKRKRVKLIYDDPIAKVEAVCESTASNVSSMLQDIRNGRKTEIDYINGFIVRQAQESGVSACVNSVLVDLVKTLESSQEKNRR